MPNWDDSWYDDDEFPPLRQRQGRGAVITVAVITFVMSAVNALSAACMLLCGLVFAAFDRAGNGQFLPGDLLQHAPLIMLATGVASLTCFIMQIVVGIGLLNSKSWARTLSLYLAGYSTLLCLPLVFSLWTGFKNDNEGQAILWFVGLVAHAGYAATVFVVLLNSRVASSFR